MADKHQPIEDEYRVLLNDLARVLDDLFNPGYAEGKAPRSTGFIMFAFAFGGDPTRRMNYISNAERADAIVALKEWIARAEGQHHEPPAMKQ